jgi:hypothetical protein
MTSRPTPQPRGSVLRRRRRPVLVAMLLTAAGIAAGVLVGPSGAVGGTGPAPVRLWLASQSAWVAPDGPFDLALRIDQAPAGGQVRVEVHDNVAVQGRIAFDRTIRGEALGPVVAAVPDLPLDALGRTTGGDYAASFPTTSAGPAPAFGFRLESDGVYPVAVTLLDARGEQRARLVTHLVRLPASTPTAAAPSRLAVALVVPLRAAPAFQPDGAVAFAPGDRERLVSTIEVLAERQRVPLTLQPSPESIDALRSTGDGADVLANLAGALGGRQVLGATYVPIDLGAFAQADATAAADEELARQLDSGRVVLSELLGTRPDYRTLVADPSVSSEVLRRFRAAGVDHVVVPERLLAPVPGSGGQPVAERFDVVTDGLLPIPGAAADESISARLVQTDDPVLNAHLLLADLAMIRYFAPSLARGVTVIVPDDALATEATMSTLLDALDQRSPSPAGEAIVAPVTLDGLFSVTDELVGPGGEREYLSPPQGSVDDLLRDVAATREVIGPFASMVEGGPGINEVILLDRQVLVAEATGTSPERREQFLAHVGLVISEQVDQIVTPEVQNLTLTSRSGRIRILIENRLAYPVQVEVALDSAKLDFPEGEAQRVTLPPQSSTPVEIAVEARASGAFPLDIAVRSPDGRRQLADMRFTVRSTAISGVGLVLSVGAGLFLLIWWARHFRSTRRDHRLVSSGHPAVRSARSPGDLEPSATLPRNQ